MTARKLTLVLSILVLSASANAFAAEFNFLKPGQVELTKLVPPPPPLGSEAEKLDMAAVLEVQKTRTPQQGKRAMDDNVLSIYVYNDVLGPNFKSANLPVLDAFFKTLHADARILLMQTKDVWARKRPHLVNSAVAPLDNATRLPYGYPSGGVMNATLTAIVLAEMVPEKRYRTVRAQSRVRPQPRGGGRALSARRAAAARWQAWRRLRPCSIRRPS